MFTSIDLLSTGLLDVSHVHSPVDELARHLSLVFGANVVSLTIVICYCYCNHRENLVSIWYCGIAVLAYGTGEKRVTPVGLDGSIVVSVPRNQSNYVAIKVCWLT